MNIGPYVLPNNVFVAPMAGVTDRPFRQLCRRWGAGYAVSEMVTSRATCGTRLKTSRRANHDGEPGPIAVQIAGTDAPMMAEAAAFNIDRGAQIIDINMGCPAKKVCNKWAGSALMQDEPGALDHRGGGRGLRCARRAGHAEDAHRLVPEHKNAVRLARAAESAGVADARDGARAHARAGLQRRGRIRHHCRREGRGAGAGGGQRRHRLAAQGARCCRPRAPTPS
jgi:tRNA-dihydrouridine synthase B